VATSGLTKKGLNSHIILGAWTIWDHHNRCVFDGANPCMAEALILPGEERQVWMMVGARGLSYLTSPSEEISVCFIMLSLSFFPISTGANVILKGCVMDVMGLFTPKLSS
jgi:hypothetical protein